MQGETVVQMIASDKLKVVVGIGATGLSVARYLTAAGERFVMVDTRENPPGLAQLKQSFPDVAFETGGLTVETLALADEVFVSPGIPLQHPVLQRVAKSGVSLTGDIALFAKAVKAPFVAITGSNGKSTVTSLLGQMCKDAGKRVAVGGNLGTPALDLLDRTGAEPGHLHLVDLDVDPLDAAVATDVDGEEERARAVGVAGGVEHFSKGLRHLARPWIIGRRTTDPPEQCRFGMLVDDGYVQPFGPGNAIAGALVPRVAVALHAAERTLQLARKFILGQDLVAAHV